MRCPACGTINPEGIPHCQNCGADFANVYIHNGNAHKYRGAYEAAIAEYQKAIRLKPNYADAHFHMGFCFERLKDYDSAIMAFTRALNINPNYANARYALATALACNGDFPSAIEAYNQVLQISPKRADAYYGIAVAYDYMGNNREAIRAYRKALDINPAYLTAKVGLARALIRNGEHKEAIKELEEALVIEPDLAEAHSDLAVAFEAAGKTYEAIDEYRKAIKSNPGAAAVHFGLALALRKEKQVEEAIESLRKAISLDPSYRSYPDAHFQLGMCYLDYEEPEKAIEAFQEAIRINHGYIDAYIALGNTYKDMNKFEEAIASYRRALEVNPNLPDVYCSMGNLLREIGNYAGAESAFQQALTLNPSYSEALFGMGRTYFVSGRLDFALETFQRLLSYDPQHLRGHKALKEVYEAMASHHEERLHSIEKESQTGEARAGRRRSLSGDPAASQSMEEALPQPPLPPPSYPGHPRPSYPGYAGPPRRVEREFDEQPTPIPARTAEGRQGASPSYPAPPPAPPLPTETGYPPPFAVVNMPGSIPPPISQRQPQRPISQIPQNPPPRESLPGGYYQGGHTFPSAPQQPEYRPAQRSQAEYPAREPPEYDPYGALPPRYSQPEYPPQGAYQHPYERPYSEGHQYSQPYSQPLQSAGEFYGPEDAAYHTPKPYGSKPEQFNPAVDFERIEKILSLADMQSSSLSAPHPQLPPPIKGQSEAEVPSYQPPPRYESRPVVPPPTADRFTPPPIPSPWDLTGGGYAGQQPRISKPAYRATSIDEIAGLAAGIERSGPEFQPPPVSMRESRPSEPRRYPSEGGYERRSDDGRQYPPQYREGGRPEFEESVTQDIPPDEMQAFARSQGPQSRPYYPENQPEYGELQRGYSKPLSVPAPRAESLPDVANAVRSPTLPPEAYPPVATPPPPRPPVSQPPQAEDFMDNEDPNAPPQEPKRQASQTESAPITFQPKQPEADSYTKKEPPKEEYPLPSQEPLETHSAHSSEDIIRAAQSAPSPQQSRTTGRKEGSAADRLSATFGGEEEDFAMPEYPVEKRAPKFYTTAKQAGAKSRRDPMDSLEEHDAFFEDEDSFVEKRTQQNRLVTYGMIGALAVVVGVLGAIIWSSYNYSKEQTSPPPIEEPPPAVAPITPPPPPPPPVVEPEPAEEVKEAVEPPPPPPPKEEAKKEPPPPKKAPPPVKEAKKEKTPPPPKPEPKKAAKAPAKEPEPAAPPPAKALTPAAYDSLVDKGYAAIDRKDFKTAIANFTQAVDGLPARGDAYIGLAEAYRFSGNNGMARKFYQQYLLKFPSGPEAPAARNGLKMLK